MENIKPQIKHVNKHEVLLRDNSKWLYFSDPCQVFSTETMDDVLPILREIECLVQEKGWYAAGFLSYEAATAFDPALKTRAIQDHSAPASSGNNAFPYLWFGLYPEPDSVSLPGPSFVKEMLGWCPTTDRETYSSAIANIKDHIGQGLTYQVNFTLRLQADFTGNAWEFFLRLAQIQNRHAAYVDTGRYIIASASPELFFQLEGNTITCRPMKGTTSRGRTTAEDLRQSEWLKGSIKNRAENVMIVDMIRNDLGRIAKTGTVTVPQLFETERYPTVWQMTSTVTAETNASLAEIFSALFPSASITGAPKVRTMDIIAKLETTPRKLYTGTIGYMAPQRKAKFNVAIRTALIDKETEKAEYGVGGGIVWDSTSKDEYAEALLKARVLLEQHPPFSLLETMLWTADGGLFLREKHVARMLDSADYFDIPLTKEHLEDYLDQISAGFLTEQRVRVVLDQHGRLSSESKPFSSLETSGPLKVSIARKPIDSSNIFLFHKTTHRDVYESARRGVEHLDDVLLYNENRELTEFTIGNLVVEFEGQLFTPPISCGVLAGTFRAHLLETGQIAERVIPVRQLNDCTRIFRVNSLRRWEIAALIA